MRGANSRANSRTVRGQSACHNDLRNLRRRSAEPEFGAFPVPRMMCDEIFFMPVAMASGACGAASLASRSQVTNVVSSFARPEPPHELGPTPAVFAPNSLSRRLSSVPFVCARHVAGAFSAGIALVRHAPFWRRRHGQRRPREPKTRQAPDARSREATGRRLLFNEGCSLPLPVSMSGKYAEAPAPSSKRASNHFPGIGVRGRLAECTKAPTLCERLGQCVQRGPPTSGPPPPPPAAANRRARPWPTNA